MLQISLLIRVMILADWIASAIEIDLVQYLIFTGIKSKAFLGSFSLNVLFWFNLLYLIQTILTKKSEGEFQTQCFFETSVFCPKSF